MARVFSHGNQKVTTENTERYWGYDNDSNTKIIGGKDGWIEKKSVKGHFQTELAVFHRTDLFMCINPGF